MNILAQLEIVELPPVVIPFALYITIKTIIWTLAIVAIVFIVNTALLCINYFILRRKNLIKSWKFLKYILLVTVGGILISLIYFIVEEYISFIIGYTFYLIFLSLGLYNYWLSKRFFSLIRKQAIFIGVVIGLVGAIIGMFSSLWLSSLWLDIFWI